MIRFLIRTAIFFVAAFVAIIVADIVLPGFSVSGVWAYFTVAIIYGLMTPEKWNARFNPQLEPDAAPGRTHWFTVIGIAVALMVGTAVLMASLAFSFQRYFEYQIEEARKISQ